MSSEKRKEAQKNQESSRPKKSYSKPQLTIHGNVKEITRLKGPSGEGGPGSIIA